jgi:hypothetical protein
MDDASNVDKGKKEGVMDSEVMGGVISLSAGIVCQINMRNQASA